MMVNYLLTCRSLTYAQKAAYALARNGIRALVMKMPQKMSPEGCTYCVKISENRLSDALIVLRNTELSPARVFASYSNGKLTEVKV